MKWFLLYAILSADGSNDTWAAVRVAEYSDRASCLEGREFFIRNDLIALRDRSERYLVSACTKTKPEGDDREIKQ
jgi:hypothetical protein